jgi:hypothetical protein
MELAGGTFKVTEGVGAIRPKRVDLQIEPARYRGSKSESAREKSDARKLRFREFLIPEPMTRFSRSRLNAVVDLIFDALPDLLGTHVRIFQ